jgi:hypothetical protein
MTEQMPPVGPAPFYPPIYAMKTHAEMTWQDLMACISAFFGLSIIALILGLVSFSEAKKAGLKQHAAGMVGLIFGAIGTAGWTLFWSIIWIAAAGSAAAGH